MSVREDQAGEPASGEPDDGGGSEEELTQAEDHWGYGGRPEQDSEEFEPEEGAAREQKEKPDRG